MKFYHDPSKVKENETFTGKDSCYIYFISRLTKKKKKILTIKETLHVTYVFTKCRVSFLLNRVDNLIFENNRSSFGENRGCPFNHDALRT